MLLVPSTIPLRNRRGLESRTVTKYGDLFIPNSVLVIAAHLFVVGLDQIVVFKAGLGGWSAAFLSGSS